MKESINFLSLDEIEDTSISDEYLKKKGDYIISLIKKSKSV